jgi:type IV pilus assembly protein PilY1
MNNKKFLNKRLAVLKAALGGVCLLAAMVANVAQAQAQISQTPLFISPPPNPNIMFTLDTSGSMSREYLPDRLPGDAQYFAQFTDRDFYTTDEVVRLHVAQFRSPASNRLGYDPAIHYVPWQKADGSYYPDSNPAAAKADPRRNETRNLIDQAIDNHAQYLAFIYTLRPNGDVNRLSDYTRKEIVPGWDNGPKGADRDDCNTGSKCTYAQEIKNFANWYTYHRQRIFTAIAGVSQAFNPLDGNQRVGFAQIDKAVDNAEYDVYGRITAHHYASFNSNGVDGVNSNTVVLGVRDFSGTNRTLFYDQLFASQPTGITPLRSSIDDVGRYFSRTDDRGPWAENPGSSRGTEYACRKAFHILMTDGYWNENNAATTAARSADNVDGPTYVNPVTGTSYHYSATASTPTVANTYYNSSASNTLADVSMYFWNHDLRPDLDNFVPTTDTDPAFWQHIVQYTVGLGVDGTLSYPADEARLKSGALTWPDPGAGDNPQAVDDLWHAAVNGRGAYFSAKDPKSFRDGLTSALTDIASQSGSAATVAVNYDRLNPTGALEYVPSFESGTWLGHLYAYPIDSAGNISITSSWDAATQLPAWGVRNIVTWNPSTSAAVPFQWANLTSAQQNYLTSVDVLEYLRGNGAKERSQTGGTLRTRQTKLGDIVNSSPLYVAQSDFGYQAASGAASGAASYRAFVQGKQTRTPMLYTGANDGMLHAFNASSGVETFAYVPNSVYPNLKSLSSATYAHHYFVDGQLVEADAYKTGDSSWKTLLLGSTGAGAKSVFALDVTAPTISSVPALGASNVLWEKNADSDANLGYVLGKAEVVRLRNGQWAAVFGNGYESANNRAVLYVVDAFTGQTISGVTASIVAGTSGGGANGLATPALVFNQARELIGAFAGDRKGNLWKFDFDTNGNGTVAYAGEPLFTAIDSLGVGQPITQRPALGFHPMGGYVVLFGTGKYFDTSDGGTTQVQTAYGIWNKPDGTVVTGARGDILQEQVLTAQTGGGSLTNVTIDWQTKRGWFIDLGIQSGSRAVGDPYVTDETTFYLTTLMPLGGLCVAGGRSQLLAINYLTGGATDVFGAVGPDGQVLSAIDVGATLSSPRAFRLPADPVCGTPGQPACVPCGGEDQPACTEPPCPKRKIVISQLGGGTIERLVSGQCQAPLRTWHQINVNY